MNEINAATLKQHLAEMDGEIKDKVAKVEDLQIEIRFLREKRRAFANRHCKHEHTYQRSVMGREIDTYCDICGNCLT
jgi:hypothetical protein